MSLRALGASSPCRGQSNTPTPTRGAGGRLPHPEVRGRKIHTMQEEGEPFLKALLRSLKSIDDPTFAAAAAYAIGQNSDPALADDIGSLTLSGILGTRENYTIIAGHMDQPETMNDTWSWLQINFPEFLKVIPGQRPRSTPRLARSLCTRQGRDELENLFEVYGSLAQGHERALAEALESIDLCIALHDAKAAEVQALGARIDHMLFFEVYLRL